MAGEVREDRLLADERCLAVGDEDGDRVCPGAVAQQDPVVLLDGHLAGQVVDAELRQALPDAT